MQVSRQLMQQAAMEVTRQRLYIQSQGGTLDGYLDRYGVPNTYQVVVWTGPSTFLWLGPDGTLGEKDKRRLFTDREEAKQASDKIDKSYALEAWSGDGAALIHKADLDELHRLERLAGIEASPHCQQPDDATLAVLPEGNAPGLSAETALEYLLHGGNCCPFCHSSHIIGCDLCTNDGPERFESITCRDCGAEWEEEYRLVGISRVHCGPTPKTPAPATNEEVAAHREELRAEYPERAKFDFRTYATCFTMWMRVCSRFSEGWS